IRELHLTPEKFPGVKGGSARLITIDASVREFILYIPAFRKLPAFYEAEVAFAEYANAAHIHAFRQSIDAVE
ncbi:YfeC-like transcriptional regulator, partial [Salmonella enterica]|uniref:YfeC-like transcriptional regulator n=1 Tax=Salmonella enterica TaxID=28901 RepID=UPI0032987A83